MLLARVAVPVPLGQAFTYSVSAELSTQVQRGARVFCEFGRRRVLAVVLDVGEREPDVPLDKLKPLVSVVDHEPVLPLELLEFLEELAKYYVAPIGEVLQLALPALERTQARALGESIKAKVVGRLVQFGRALPLPDSSAVVEGVVGAPKPERPLSARALELHAYLMEHGPTPITELQQNWKSARSMLKNSSAFAIEQRELEPSHAFDRPVVRDTAPELNVAQRAALTAIHAKLEAQERAAFLLDGVTASGKTEVYLGSVARALELGRGAIVLVPEIALTPQLVGRFRARLGDAIAVLHSALGEGERHAMWKALRAGTLRVAVGARSALFAPVHDLGLICVDEEHDGSFKQEDGVRYNARDMALLRAHRARAVCVLGSATPSISSLALVERGRLEHLVLPSRAHRAAQMPDVEIVDLRRIGAAPFGERLLSIRLFRELERTLEEKRQAILFLNRRGFAPSLICDACGTITECPHCAVALTVHRARGERLRCHYCDYSSTRPSRCAKCGSEHLSEEGAGTERIEAVLASALPGARVARLDRDVASGEKSAQIMDRMRQGEIDILVGTQMVTKGHDLPNVTLVCVLNADSALSLPDYRASERSFHLFVQVAGRAGRADAKGLVLIQTRNPEHPAIRCALQHDVKSFVAQELALREELEYPPFSRLVLLRVDAIDAARAQQAAIQVAKIARNSAPPEVRVVGPAPAPIPRLRGRYRFHVLLRAKERGKLQKPLIHVARAELNHAVRLAIDVDPVNML
ncbi:MAG TPA: primosomal protein N' [Polyangiaceae bacterium]|nr:primosomal protein N' [Polyangiaceae bacterium]